MYYGFTRMLGEIEPSKLACLNLPKCCNAILIDRAVNDISFRRQAKVDNGKTKAELRMQDFVSTAALMTLCGFDALVMNRWATSVHANRSFAEGVFGKMVVDGASLAESAANVFAENAKKRVSWNVTCVGAGYKNA